MVSPGPWANTGASARGHGPRACRVIFMKERVCVRLPAELARWLRRRAVERHMTLTGVIEECLRLARFEERMELLVRGTLDGVARLLAGEGAGPGEVRRVKLELLSAAKGEVERAGKGEDNPGA